MMKKSGYRSYLLLMIASAVVLVAILATTAVVTVEGLRHLTEFHPAQLKDGGIVGKNRMRPIAMTTSAAILALLPLAMGIGHGSTMQKPLAIAIISGLVVQLPLVLVVLPAFLKVLKTKNPVGGFEGAPPGEKRHSPGNKTPMA